MKFIFILGLIIWPFSSNAQADFEKQISHCLDSNFTSNSIIWENTRNEFLLYGTSIFKKAETINDFLAALNEKPDKLKNNKIGPSEYPELNKLCTVTPKIM